MFETREQAGILLAVELKKKGYGDDCVVFAIPRGGVVTGRAVADSLGCPLDIIVTRKIPAPNQPELALGAVGPGGTRVIDVSLSDRVGVNEAYLKEKIKELEKSIKKMEKKFRVKRIDETGKTVLVTDDGVATGATVEVALRYLKNKNLEKLVLATPVASQEAVRKLSGLVDDIVVLEIPEDFGAVGQFYDEFPQVSDEEVIQLLKGS